MTKTDIESFLSEPALAIVGVSRSGGKFGNTALRTLQAKGIRVYAIHPSAQAVDGVRSYPSFNDLPEPVKAVLVVVPPAKGVQVVRDAIAAGITKIWLQQGAESPEVVQACRDGGVEPIVGECVLMFAHPAGIHRVHHWIRGVFGRLPA